jgi:hypothetical protein
LLRRQRRIRFFGLTCIEHHEGLTPQGAGWITGREMLRKKRMSSFICPKKLTQ